MHRGFFDESVQNTWISARGSWDSSWAYNENHEISYMNSIYIYVGEKMFQIIGISLLHMGVFVVILLWHVIDVRQQMPRI